MCKQLNVVLAAYQVLWKFMKKCLFPPSWSVFLVGFALFNFLLVCHISRYILQWESFNNIIGSIWLGMLKRWIPTATLTSKREHNVRRCLKNGWGVRRRNRCYGHPAISVQAGNINTEHFAHWLRNSISFWFPFDRVEYRMRWDLYWR